MSPGWLCITKEVQEYSRKAQTRQAKILHKKDMFTINASNFVRDQLKTVKFVIDEVSPIQKAVYPTFFFSKNDRKNGIKEDYISWSN